MNRSIFPHRAILFCGSLLVVGCATIERPHDQLSQAESAIEHAKASEASKQAPLPLRKAEDKLEKAHRAMDAKDYERARRFAEQALVDARLAEARAGAKEAKESAQDLEKTIESLKEEIDRLQESS